MVREKQQTSIASMNAVPKAGAVITEKKDKRALRCSSRVNCSQKPPHVPIELGKSSAKLTTLYAIRTWRNRCCATKLWRVHMMCRIIKEPWRAVAVTAFGDKAFRCSKVLIAEREKVGWLLNDALRFASRAT